MFVVPHYFNVFNLPAYEKVGVDFIFGDIVRQMTDPYFAHFLFAT